MKRCFVWILFFIILSLAAPAAPRAAVVDPLAADATSATYRTGIIDPRSSSLPTTLTARLKQAEDADLTALALYLAEGSTDGFHTVKRIHDWITDNIAYDTDSFFGLDDDGSGKPLGVVRLGRTTCGGFSALFAELCRRVGLETRTIKGISRNYIGPNGSPSGHVWNAVRISGRWYLVDVTADNRFGYYRDTFGKKRDYRDTSLFLHPQAKIMGNLPERAEDQFLERAVTRQEFLAAPKLQSGVLRYRAEFITDLPSLVKKVVEPRPGGRQIYLHDQISASGTLRIELRVPPHVVISCALKERDRAYDDELGGVTDGKPKTYPANAFSYAEADRRVCLFSTPDSGVFDAFISAREEGEARSQNLYSFRIKSEGHGEMLPPAGRWHNRRADTEAVTGLATGTPVEMVDGYARLAIRQPMGNRNSLSLQLRTSDDAHVKGAIQTDIQDGRTIFYAAFPSTGEYRLRLVDSDPKTPGKTITLTEARVSAAASGELPPPKTLVRQQILAANQIRIVSEDVTKGCNNGICTIVATAPDGVELAGTLKDPTGKSSPANVASGKIGNEWRFYFRSTDASGRWQAAVGLRDATRKIQYAARFRLPTTAAPQGPLLPPSTLLLNGAFFHNGGMPVSDHLAASDGMPRFSIRVPEGYKVRCRLTNRDGKAINKAATAEYADGIWTVTLSPPERVGVTGQLVLSDPAGKGTTVGVFRLE